MSVHTDVRQLGFGPVCHHLQVWQITGNTSPPELLMSLMCFKYIDAVFSANGRQQSFKNTLSNEKQLCNATFLKDELEALL